MMLRGKNGQSLLTWIMLAVIFCSLQAWSVHAQSNKEILFNDSHFHLTNFIQDGITIERYLQLMGDKVGRSTLFGIPLQQQWSYQNSGSYAPAYYLQSDATLYYYSFMYAWI